MHIYHDYSIKIQSLLRKINRHQVAFCNADFIDVHPLAALTLFFGALYSMCPKNRHKVMTMIAITIDEISCCIGNRKLCEEFSFHRTKGENLYISGSNNKEIIEAIIKQMVICYNSVAKEKILFC